MKNKSKRLERSLRVIQYLIKQHHPVSLTHISQDIGLNVNTLKKDLPYIENLLSAHHTKLMRKPGVGLWIEGEKQQNKIYKNFLQLQNKHLPLDAKTFILHAFLTEKKSPTVEDFCDMLELSKPTVLKHIKTARTWLSNHAINLVGKPGVGYKLYFTEDNMRNAIVDFIEEFETEKVNELMACLFTHKKSCLFKFNAIDALEFIPIKTFVDKMEVANNTDLTDKDYASFVLKIAVSIHRLKHNFLIRYESKKLLNIMQHPVYRSTSSLILNIEEYFNIRFFPEDIAYITLSFISSKVKESSMLNIISNKDYSIYTEYAKEIATIANNIFGLPITKDTEFIHMLALHLKSTLNKIKYGMKIKNPLLKEIKEEYPLSFDIAENVTKILSKKLNLNIPEEEAGYIAMYIATAVEKIKHTRIKRKKVAVVCAMAMGTSSLLFWRLLNEMPDLDVVQIGSYKDIVEGKLSKEVDLVVSTIPLPPLQVPHIVVSPFLNSDERREIREILGIAKGRCPYPSKNELSEILNRSVIIPQLKAANCKEAISILGKQLFKKGLVKEGFIDAVISREREFPTGLNTPIPIALPHTEFKYSKKESFAIATLKNTISFREMGNPENRIDAKIILIPVLVKNNEEKTVFYDLFKKCRDKNIATRLLSAKNEEEIKQILEKPYK